jgi:hypothetical protein
MKMMDAAAFAAVMGISACSGSSIAITRVQGTSSLSANPLSATFSGAVGRGHGVIVTVSGFGLTAPGGLTPATVTDDQGNTYPAIAGAYANSDNGYGIQAFFLPNVTNGPTTITATVGPRVGLVTVSAEEFTTSTSATVDVVGGYNSNVSSGSNQVITPAVTTTASGDLICVAGTMYDSHPFSAGAEYTMGINGGGPWTDFVTEWRVQGSAGAISGTMTLTSTTAHVANVIVAIGDGRVALPTASPAPTRATDWQKRSSLTHSRPSRGG